MAVLVLEEQLWGLTRWLRCLVTFTWGLFDSFKLLDCELGLLARVISPLGLELESVILDADFAVCVGTALTLRLERVHRLCHITSALRKLTFCWATLLLFRLGLVCRRLEELLHGVLTCKSSHFININFFRGVCLLGILLVILGF